MVLGVPPSPIPAPLPPWAKFLVQLTPLIVAGLQEALEFIGTMNHSASATPDGWMRVMAVGQPNGSIDAADKFATTFDLVNITNGKVDNTWTSTDFTTCDTQLSNLLASWAANMNQNVGWTELRYYQMFFNDYTSSKPFVKSGPPVHIHPAIFPGAGLGAQAGQVALTSTEQTTYPKHWGRNYWPYPGALFEGNNRYVKHTVVDAFAAAQASVYSNLMTAEFFPVVPVTQVDKVPTRGLLGVTQIQIDDVYDVIRRRRPHLTTYRALP